MMNGYEVDNEFNDDNDPESKEKTLEESYKDKTLEETYKDMTVEESHSESPNLDSFMLDENIIFYDQSESSPRLKIRSLDMKFKELTNKFDKIASEHSERTQVKDLKICLPNPI